MEFSSDLSSFLMLKHLRAKLGTHFLTPATKAKAIQSHGLLNEAVERFFKHFIVAECVLNNISQQEGQQEIHPLYSNSLPLLSISEIACVDSELTPKPLDSSKKEALVKRVEANVLELKRNVTRFTQHFDGWNTNVTQITTVPLELVNLLATYQKELSEGTEVLQEWLKIMETKLCIVLRTIHLFSLKGETLLLKIKVLHQKILMKTYTTESLEVLKEIKQQIQERLERSRITASRAESQLEAFRALGPKFDSLAEHHARLVENVKRLTSANNAMRKVYKGLDEKLMRISDEETECESSLL